MTETISRTEIPKMLRTMQKTMNEKSTIIAKAELTIRNLEIEISRLKKELAFYKSKGGS